MKIKQDPPTPFRLKPENLKKLKEIEDMIPTISSRNAAMNYIIQSYHEVVVIPRSKKKEEIKADMKAFGISISELH